MPERRRHPRIKCSIKLGLDNGSRECEAVDLSLGGICVRTSQLEPVGSTVSLTMELQELDKVIEVAASVRHIILNPHNTMGLEFVDMREVDFSTLMTYLNMLYTGAWPKVTKKNGGYDET